MSKCPFPIGLFKNHKTGEEVFASCRQWGCPVCGPVKKNQLLDRVKKGFTPDVPLIPAEDEEYEEIKPYNVRMLTLTLRAGTDDTQITKYWNTLRTELKDAGFKLGRFFWTKEFTKRGTRHLHVLIDCYIPRIVIRKLWKRITGGSYIVHISRMRVKNPAGYASKYLTKGFSEGEFKKYERRYGCSRHFPPSRVRASDGTWEFRWNPEVGVLVWRHSIYGQGFDTEDSWRDAWKTFVIPENKPKYRKYPLPRPPDYAVRLNGWLVAGLFDIFINIDHIAKIYKPAIL